MRILLAQSAVYVPTHGGENKANRLLLEALAGRGHECRVLAPAFGVQGAGSEDSFREELARRELRLSGTRPRSFSFESNGVAVEALRDSSKLPAALAEEIARFAPDRVLVSSEDPGHGLLEAAAETQPARTVYLAHTMLFFPFGPNSFARSRAMTDGFRKLGGVITVSSYLKDYIRQWSGREAAVIPFPAFGPGPFPDLGRSDRGTVTFINPCAYKGITIFLELARSMPDVSFAAVPSWGTTAADRAALERQDNVRILPARDDLDELFENTRALLVPSLWAEGFPLVPVEAMLRGIPVLASDSGGLREAKLGVPFVLPVRPIEKYTDRFDEKSLPIAIVPEQDVDPWRTAVRSLLSDRASYEQLASESRSAAEEYVRRLGAGPFESYLEALPGTSAPRSVSHGPRPEAGREEIRRRVEHLTPEKRALVLARLRKKPAAADDFIRRRRAEEEQAVSFAQERLWFLDRMNPGSAAYNNFDGFRLRGALDPSVLERAFGQVIGRHEPLRTVFKERDGRPVAVVSLVADPTLRRLDRGGTQAADRDREVGRLAIEEARRPFDLARGPLIRGALIRFEDDDHVLFLTMHHIVSDGWSFGIFVRELGTLYESLLRDRPSPLPELPIQYGDFARWQRASLSGEVLEQELSYWKTHLLPLAPVLQLPTDRPRPRIRTDQGGRERAVWDAAFAEELRQFSRTEGVTVFMTLMAAFQAFLFRASGQRDVSVGTAVANRTRSETEGLVGFFANTLVLRGRFSSEITFRELLQQVREAAVGAYGHQDLPFEKLVEALKPERDMSHTPLFQSMFLLQNTPREPLRLPGLTLEPLILDTGTSKVDLTFQVTGSPDGMLAEMEFSRDLFDGGSARRALGHLRTLLEGAMKGPQHKVSALPVLTEQERQAFQADWDRTTREYERELCAHELFERQAASRPEATAVVSGADRWTYAQLNRRADSIAGHLRSLGVGPEVTVAIRVGRSPEMVAAVLGVLKAGGAYVPFDPQTPSERLAFMIQDSRPAVLVTEKALDGQAAAGKMERLFLEDVGREVPTGGPALSPSSDNLAYVIYTSGSTGRPKGVAISHRSVTNLLGALREAPGLEASDRFTAVATLAFDMSVLDLLFPLSIGAAVVVAPRGAASDGAQLRNVLESSGSTVLHGAPSVWRLLLGAGWRGGEHFRILSGGEALPRDLAEDLLHRGRFVWNLYGPTETTVYSSVLRVESGEGPVPIAPAMANTRFAVIDWSAALLPVGWIGELAIGGDGVARGYWGRPDLTAASFVPDPFAPSPGSRMYRTGDLVRFREDGRLEFEGRIDYQVKLRGFRIELGEIEARLQEHPAIRGAVVVAREDEGQEKRLVAYLVGSAGEPPEPGALRAFLKDRLPDYMVPSRFVWMDRLPLSQSGKVNRAALPQPEWTQPRSEGGFVAARSPGEQALADIFAQVLGLDRVSTQDDFFELGGHSLLATQVVSRIRDNLRIEVPVRQLFETPTVADLAAAISESRAKAAGPVGRIPRVPREDPIPLSFAQQGLWFLDQLEPGNPFYNVFLSLHVSGSLDAAALEQTLGEIVRRHEALRTVFPTVNGRAVQSILAAAPVVLRTQDLRRLRGKQRRLEAERYATEEVRRPFDLARGPLLRGSLLRFAEDEHLLLLTMHHIACDGWSIGLLIRELAALYGAFSRGLPSPLEPLPIQYADYAVWQRGALSGEGLRQKLAYWKRQLEGSPTRLDLAIARPRPAVMDHRGEIRRFEIPGNLSDAIKALSRRERATLFMTLVAAFQALLAHSTGQEDVVIGTDVANRTEVEVEGMIGHFVNQVVLRTDLAGDPSFLELLRRVREVTLEAYANQDAPFDKVVEAVRPERSLRYSPLFQVKLVLQGAPVSVPESFPWTSSALEVHSGMVKFDLLMSLRDDGTSLAGTMEYATVLFDAATIDRLLDDFRLVLGRVVSDPDIRWSAIRDFLTEEERRRELRRKQDLKDASLQKVAGARRKAVFAEAETEDLP